MASQCVRAASVVALAVSLAAASSAQAQDPSDFQGAGYLAIVASPIGALPPYLIRDQFLERGSPSVLHLRYGARKIDSIFSHAAAATLEFPLGIGRIGFTGGIKRENETTLGMLGMEYQTIMSRGMLTPDPAGPVLHITVKTELGFGTSLEGPTELTAATGALSIVMSVPFGNEIMIVPFATPGIGVGMLSTGGDVQFQPQVIVGGGFVIHNPSRLDLTLAVHRGLADEASTVYGIGLTWNR